MELDPAGFESLGRDLAGYKTSHCYDTKRRRFVSFFGIEACLVSRLWSMLIQHGKLAILRSPKPIHLLWALMFLQVYDTEERNAARCKCDEKTFRKWAWWYAEAVADLDEYVVSLLRLKFLLSQPELTIQLYFVADCVGESAYW